MPPIYITRADLVHDEDERESCTDCGKRSYDVAEPCDGLSIGIDPLCPDCTPDCFCPDCTNPN